MDRQVTIDGRTYDRIAMFCSKNGMDTEKYIMSAITERINIDMYGDLNRMIARKEPEKPNEMVISVSSDGKSEKPKRTRKKKEKEEIAPNSDNGTVFAVDNDPYNNENENAKDYEKQQRKRRTIETKK